MTSVHSAYSGALIPLLSFANINSVNNTVLDSSLQPLVFDLLPTKDGLYVDDPASSDAPRHDICLTADYPTEWERIRYLPLPKVLEELQTETKFKVPVSRE